MNKIAWVTGGGSGIGKALARLLYLDGYWVIISGRRKNILDQAAQEIKTGHSSGDIWAAPGDASDGAYVEGLHKAVRERWGDVSLLINNAGENPYHSIQDASPEEFEQNFRVNCMSAIRCTKLVLPAMKERREGMIVNVSSILGKWASAASPAYSISKYAMTGFTDSLRQDLMGSGVHVMGVYPGFIRTALTAPFVEPGSLRDKVGKTPEAMARVMIQGIRQKKRDVFYPWYVSISLRLHGLFPGMMETIRKWTGH